MISVTNIALKMILLFHALMYAINELSTPVWHNEVRHITYQVVEAMREAETEKNVTQRLRTNSSRKIS